MSDRDPRDEEETAREARAHLRKGLGLFWRAAQETATGLRKELDRSNVGKAIDDASRELVRATSNVVNRLGTELRKVQPPEPKYGEEPYAREREGEREGDRERDPPKGGPANGPTGPTEEDPGFTIAGGARRGARLDGRDEDEDDDER